MPLENRVIEPICISRGTLPLDAQGSLAISIPNELECVTNGSLANVIRQLSSLSRYAEDVFAGIIKETGSLISRTTCLQGRIDRLSIRVTQLDSAVEEVSIHDIHLKKPFKSSTSYDQQVMSRSTIPQSLLDQYKCCDKPPPLSKLNQFRDDNKDGLKFYTDPTYFFELWRQEMLQITERESKIASKKGLAHRSNSKSSASSSNGILPGASPAGSKGHQVLMDGQQTSSSRQKRNPRQPCNTRERYQMQAAQQEFLPLSSNASPHDDDAAAGQMYQSADQNGGLYQSAGAYGTLQHPHHYQHHRPNSLEINQYTENPYGVHQHLQQVNRQSSSSSSQQQLPPDYGYGGGSAAAGQQHMLQQQNYHSNKIISNDPYGHPPPHQQPPQTPPTQHHSNNNSNPQLTPTRRGGTPNHHRPSQPPPAPPSGPSSGSSSGQGTPTAGTPSRGNSRGTSVNREVLPPPPPPPPMPPMSAAGIGNQFDHAVNGGDHRCSSSSDQSLPPPPPMAMNNNNNNSIGKMNGQQQQPPPPPPMPNNCMDSGDRPDGADVNSSGVPSFAQQILAKQSQMQSSSASSVKKNSSNRIAGPQHHVVNDARSGLLQAIREGIKLRRVEDSKVREAEKAAPCNDVASILARRVPQELSDSDSDDHSGFESDAWDDG